VTADRLSIRVEGRVQGVGFRFFTQDTADRLAVTGWVRNTPDGAVEAEAQASAEILQNFVDALLKGPPLGRVSRLNQQPREPRSDSCEFRIRYR
jgi:acylphosphatase